MHEWQKCNLLKNRSIFENFPRKCPLKIPHFITLSSKICLLSTKGWFCNLFLLKITDLGDISWFNSHTRSLGKWQCFSKFHLVFWWPFLWFFVCQLVQRYSLVFSLGIMQIYLEQIALFGFFGQCIWSKCPKTHIKNLVESSAGNYA